MLMSVAMATAERASIRHMRFTSSEQDSSESDPVFDGFSSCGGEILMGKLPVGWKCAAPCTGNSDRKFPAGHQAFLRGEEAEVQAT
jgi:hypothetical protein